MNYWYYRILFTTLMNWVLGMEAPQLLFLSPPSPWEKEYLIARWSSFLKQRLVTKSVALVGKKVTNSLIWGFYCTETRQRFHATRRCISLCWSEKCFLRVREILWYSLRRLLLQTVSILEQMLTMTENKLRKCLGNQQKITLQIRPNE